MILIDEKVLQENVNRAFLRLLFFYTLLIFAPALSFKLVPNGWVRSQ
jgi:hypothetical protein